MSYYRLKGKPTINAGVGEVLYTLTIYHDRRCQPGLVLTRVSGHEGRPGQLLEVPRYGKTNAIITFNFSKPGSYSSVWRLTVDGQPVSQDLTIAFNIHTACYLVSLRHNYNDGAYLPLSVHATLTGALNYLQSLIDDSYVKDHLPFIEEATENILYSYTNYSTEQRFVIHVVLHVQY